MQILRTVAEVRAWRRQAIMDQKQVHFVPTMGFLHAGHQSLMAVAKARGGLLLVSIFVNPLQFGAGEDLDNYPRDEAGDLAKIREIDPEAAVFLPQVEDIYPPGYCTRVIVSGLTQPLCGRSRPTHFEGVTTVVCRLFGLVQPDVAFFGEKDYQQLKVIERMVHDLALGVEVVGVPIKREADGLAMSSRNAYLTPEERVAALVLSQALNAAESAFQGGLGDPEALVQLVRAHLQGEGRAQEDYIEALHADSLETAQDGDPLVLALAAHVGRARLIDNRVLRR